MHTTQASIKNFQLIDQNDPTEETLLLFGRVDKNKFTCDFKHPLSPMQVVCKPVVHISIANMIVLHRSSLQAFAIVLANFDFD